MNKRKYEALKKLNPQKIVVVLPRFFGDAVMAAPVFKQIRMLYPKAHITAMGGKPETVGSYERVFEGHSDVDDLYFYPNYKGKSLIEKFKILSEMRRKLSSYELGVIMRNERSPMLSLVFGGVKNRLAYKESVDRRWFANLFITHPIPNPKMRQHLHDVEKNQILLASLGVTHFNEVPTLFVTADEETSALKRLEGKGYIKGSKLLVISPKAAPYDKAKNWDLNRFIELVKRFIEEDKTVFILFVGSDHYRNTIEEAIRGLSPRVISFMGGTTVRELMGLVKISRGVITVDTGIMHLAAALRVPLVAIFGASSDVETGPYGWGRVVKQRVACSPCLLHLCPIDHRCMTGVSVDMVYRAFQEELGKQKADAWIK